MVSDFIIDILVNLLELFELVLIPSLEFLQAGSKIIDLFREPCQGAVELNHRPGYRGDQADQDHDNPHYLPFHCHPSRILLLGDFFPPLGVRIGAPGVAVDGGFVHLALVGHTVPLAVGVVRSGGLYPLWIGLRAGLGLRCLSVGFPAGGVYVRRPHVAVDQALVQGAVVVDHVSLAVGIVGPGGLCPDGIPGIVQAERCVQALGASPGRVNVLAHVGLGDLVELRIAHPVYTIGHDVPCRVGRSCGPCGVHGGHRHGLFVGQGGGENLKRLSQLLRCLQSVVHLSHPQQCIEHLGVAHLGPGLRRQGGFPRLPCLGVCRIALDDGAHHDGRYKPVVLLEGLHLQAVRPGVVPGGGHDSTPILQGRICPVFCRGFADDFHGVSLLSQPNAV
nr:MAG TPA: hypothetical protein [Caudoviricetes sp.]